MSITVSLILFVGAYRLCHLYWSSMSGLRVLSGIRKLCHRIFTKIITEKLQKTIAKVLQKSYNMVTERARPFWIMKSFSSCFLEYRVSAILLRLFSFTAVGRHRTGDIPLRVQKSPSGFRRAFLRPKIWKNRSIARESMTLGQFACFSAKDIYKVWRDRGLYSVWVCGKVYTINS